MIVKEKDRKVIQSDSHLITCLIDKRAFQNLAYKYGPLFGKVIQKNILKFKQWNSVSFLSIDSSQNHGQGFWQIGRKGMKLQRTSVALFSNFSISRPITRSKTRELTNLIFEPGVMGHLWSLVENILKILS